MRDMEFFGYREKIKFT